MKISISLEALTGMFETDIKRAGATTAKFAKQAEDDLKRAGAAIGGALATGFTVAGTALVVWTKQTMDTAKQIERLAGIANTSNTEFQRWSAGAREAGIEQEKLADILKDVQDKVGDFLQTGGGALADFFENIAPAVGVTAEQFRNLSGPQALQLYVDSLEKANLSQSEMAFYMEAIASDTTALLPLLRNGGKAMKDYGDQAERLGAVMSDKTIASTKELQRITREMDQQFTAFKTNIVVGLMPAIEDLASEINSPEFREGFGAIAEGAINAAAKVAGLVAELGKFTRWMGEQAARDQGFIDWTSVDDIQGRIDQLSKARSGIVWDLGGEGGRIDEELARLNAALPQAIKGQEDARAAAAAHAKELANQAEAAQKAADESRKKGAGLEIVTERDRKAAEAAAKAAEAERKFAEETAKLNAEIYGGIDGLQRMARSFEQVTDPLEEVQRTYEDAGRAMSEALTAEIEKIEEQRAKTGDAAAAANQHAAAQEAVAAAMRNAAATRDANIAAINAERDVTGRYVKELREEAKLLGMTSQQRRVEATVLRATAEAKRLNVEIDEEAIRQQTLANIKLEEVASILEELEQKSPFEQLTSDIKLMGEALAEATDEKKISRLTDALDKMRKTQILANTKAFLDLGQAVVGSMKDAAEEGTRQYAALEVAQSALALGQGIVAILTQGQGEPMSAFARMAAMAAVVIPLAAQAGASIRAFAGSGFSDTAAQRQASQGTGSVLGDSEAKSESILNATEITANATTQLVGINRGMLNALKSLQDGLGSAAVMLARGAGEADFSGMNLAVKQFDFKDPLTQAILGGKSKLTDQGIIIFGGALQELIDNIAVGAYQEVQSRSWAFGSTRTREGIKDVSDQFGDQFSLIISSIADTVREGALALGLLPAEVQSALESFRVEEIRISLKDLSAEEQQAELQAVFSKIFDDLAGHVVPFIEQFQKVGEGLGETLVRVATGVQVTREAVRYLGFALDETDPEKFAQISEGLIDMVGGIDSLIEGMTSFVSNFAPESHRLQVATDAINSAFEQAGLAVPETAEAMWDLMRSFDATTEEGRESIATLLRLAGVSKEYYDLLDKAEKARRDYAAKSVDLKIELGDGSEFVAARAEVEAWTSSMIEDLDSLARAAGRAGASEQDLVNVHRVAAQRVAQLIEQLKTKTRDLAVELGYISQADTLESLTAQIESLQSSSAYAAEGIGDAVDSIRQQMDLLLGDLSPFNDQKKLELALEGLRDGTVDPQQVLEIGRRLYASTSAYTDLFNNVMGMVNFGAQTGGTNSASAGETGDGRSLAELIRLRDEMLEAQRPEIADQLARRLAELSIATGEEFADIAENMGWTLDRLAEDLSLSDDQLQAYLEQLAEQFESQDFIEVADLITAAIDNSADRIVDAIKNPDVSDAADDRGAEIARDLESSRARESDRVADELVALGDRLISTIMSATHGQTGELSEVLEATRRDLRESVLERRAVNERAA